MSVDLFVSYARKDDQPAAAGEQGWISAFVAALRREHRRYSTSDLALFLDRDVIRVADDWELRVRASLHASRLLLAFISPDYFHSTWCEKEWDLFVQHESEKALAGEALLPLYLVDVPKDEKDAKGVWVSQWGDDLARRQWLDLRAARAQDHAAFATTDFAVSIEMLDQKITTLLDRANRALRAPGTVDRANVAFVGRGKELRRLRRLFTADSPTGTIVSVHGLGGVGKSALVAQYAHDQAANYPGGRWVIRCEGLQDLAAAIMQLASPLRIEFDQQQLRDPDLALERVLAELKQRTTAAAAGLDPACLVILDNVDQPALVAPAQIARLPGEAWLHVLITTRLGPDQLYASESDRAFLGLDELPVNDAVRLIERQQPGQHFANDSERAAAKAISKRLGGFPLAVEAVAVFLGLNPEVTCSGFLKRLGEEGLDAPDRLAGEADVANRIRHRDKQLSSVFTPAIAQLGEVERFVLHAAAVLPADFIALPWLREWATGRFPDLAAARPGYAAPWPQIVRRLTGRRLLVPTDDVEPDGSPRLVRMHRLLQEWLSKQEGFARAELTARLHVHAQARLTSLGKEWADAGTRWELDPLTAVAAQRLAAGDEESVTFVAGVAGLLPRSARFAQAETLWRDALAMEERAPAASKAQLSQTLQGLAGLLLSIARYEESETLFRRALTLDEARLDAGDPQLATECNNLAVLQQITGRPDQAIELYQRALAIYEKSFGPESSEVAAALNNVGQLLQNQDRLEDAGAVMRRVVAIQSKHYKRDDPALAVGLLNLGRLLYFLGQLDEAGPLVQRALDLEEAAFGPEYHGLATNLLYLADIVTTQGDYSEAEVLLRRALTLKEAAYGAEHPETARIQVSLSRVLAAVEEWDESKALARRALEINNQLLGSNHPNTLAAVRALTDALVATGRMDEAAPMSQRILVGALEKFVNGEIDPNLGGYTSDYTALLKQQGYEEDAIMAHLREIFGHFGIDYMPDEREARRQPRKRARPKSKPRQTARARKRSRSRK